MNFQGAEPFNMTVAADYLESLARGTFDCGEPVPVHRTSPSRIVFFYDCLISVLLARILPTPGPAVGLGLRGRQPIQVQRLEAETRMNGWKLTVTHALHGK